MRNFIFIALIVALYMIAGGPSVAADYTAHALGIAPGYDGSEATDINAGGVVMCWAAGAHDDIGAFTWSEEKGITDLSGLGIFAFAGINNEGQTAGIYTDSNPNWKFEPLILNSDGTENRLHVPEGVSNAWAQKILDDSSIFSSYEYRDAYGTTTTKFAIIDANGVTTFVESPEDEPSLSAVSNNGIVVLGDKYLWTISGGLSTLPWLVNAGQVDITGVNDLGWVVGTLYGHVVRWDSNGNMSDLGVGIAKGINNKGQVVGSINDTAVVWNADGSIIDLPSLTGYSYAVASAINDGGQVVGTVWGNDVRMAVLWEPVPEPTSLLALAAGLAGLVIRRRR